MYREVIAKQQAAINKQKELIRILEEELHKANELNKANQKNIENLKLQIEHLNGVVDWQCEQIVQFEKAAWLPLAFLSQPYKTNKKKP